MAESRREKRSIVIELVVEGEEFGEGELRKLESLRGRTKEIGAGPPTRCSTYIARNMLRSWDPIKRVPVQNPVRPGRVVRDHAGWLGRSEYTTGRCAGDEYEPRQ